MAEILNGNEVFVRYQLCINLACCEYQTYQNYIMPLKGKSEAGTTQGEHVINRATRIISPLTH